MLSRLAWVSRSLQARVVAAFAIAVTAMVVTSVVVVVQLRPVADTLNLVAEGYLPLARQVAQLKRDQERVQRDIVRLTRDRPRPGGEASAAEIYAEEVRDNVAVTLVIARRLRSSASTPAEVATASKVMAHLEAIDAVFARYGGRVADYLTASEAAAGEAALDGLRRDLRADAKALAEELDRLERTLDTRITRLTEEGRQAQARALVVATGLSLMGAALGFFLLAAVLVALRPIGLLTAQVQRLAAGEPGARVDVRGADEVGLLAAEFNAMAAAIEARDQRLTERAAQLRVVSRHLESVVASLDDGLFVVEDGRVTLANPAAERAWGVRRGAVPPEALRGATRPGRHALTTAEGRQVVARVVPFGDHGAVAVLADVTELVVAQDRLARSERLALVGQMLAQITHEVRNPLNALSLNAELLGDELAALDPGHTTEAWEILAMVAGEVQRLTDVTGHYLQLARRPRAALAPADLGGLVQEVVRLLEPELLDAHVEVTRDLHALPPQRVDGNQVRQALHNVVRNALEAGARRITITLDRRDDELVLALADDGPGMSADDVARATDPFFSTKASGTGLGLAITRQILEDHGGALEVDSAPGEGTTVRMVLPWRPCGEEEAT